MRVHLHIHIQPICAARIIYKCEKYFNRLTEIRSKVEHRIDRFPVTVVPHHTDRFRQQLFESVPKYSADSQRHVRPGGRHKNWLHTPSRPGRGRGLGGQLADWLFACSAWARAEFGQCDGNLHKKWRRSFQDELVLTWHLTQHNIKLVLVIFHYCFKRKDRSICRTAELDNRWKWTFPTANGLNLWKYFCFSADFFELLSAK